MMDDSLKTNKSSEGFMLVGIWVGEGSEEGRKSE